MPKETMTPRERWLAVMRREKPDRVPMDYWATGEATHKLMSHLGCANTQELYARLHIDYVFHVGARYVGPPAPDGEDLYGIRYRTAQHDGGAYSECVHNPLASYASVDEIEANYKRWLNPDWFDVSHVRDQVENAPPNVIRGGGSEPFLLYKNLRGQEQAFIDLIENPEIVHYCLDKLFDLACETTTRLYEAANGKIDFSYVAEDMGAQEGLMLSKAQIEEFLAPRMKRMMDLAHSAGVYVFHHNDGAVRDILPTMIETGVDLLNPIQWRCAGMERVALKRDFGNQIVFHGGMDNQQTLVFGSVEEVRQEVADNLRILGAGGGYILAPCHNIQVVSPAENIVAMYDEGYALGWT